MNMERVGRSRVEGRVELTGIEFGQSFLITKEDNFFLEITCAINPTYK